MVERIFGNFILKNNLVETFIHSLHISNAGAVV